MAQELVFNMTGGALVLCSYLQETRPERYRFRPLVLDALHVAKDWLNPDVVFCLSIQSIGDARLVEQLVSLVRPLRAKKPHAPKLIVGGPFFDAIHCGDFLREFPEISYIVRGHGEQALAAILESPPLEPVVMGPSYGPRPRSQLQPVLPWHAERSLPVCLGEGVCHWGRCRFCHHAAPVATQKVSLREFTQQIVHYYHAYGWRYFHIYDNHLQPDDLLGILDEMEAAGIEPVFDVFGIRMTPEALALAPRLKQTRMVRMIGWGMEVYSQRVLNLYRKGIAVKNIQPILEVMHDAGVFNVVYALLGLPGMQAEDYEKTCEFCEAHAHPDGLIQRVIVNWFLLDRSILDHLDHRDIRIRPGEPFRMSQYYGNADELCDVRTEILNFEDWDREHRRWRTREEVFRQHLPVLDRMLSVPLVHYDHLAFFLEPSVWKELWGDRYARWQQLHAPVLARPQ